MPELARRRRPLRRGATVVEFAITAPVLLLLVFASIEFGRLNMIRHSLDNAVYEGVRKGMTVNSTPSSVQSTVQNLLTASGVRAGSVDVALSETEVVVTASASVADNAWVVPSFLTSGNLTSSLTLSRK